MKAILLLFLLSACGYKAQINMVDADPELLPYIQAFEASARLNSAQLPAYTLTAKFVAQLPPYQIAVCVKESGKAPTILVSSEYWQSYSQWDKREVMFHELGHCVLNLSHNDTAANLMNTYHLGPSHYNELTYTQFDTNLFK